MRDTYWRIKNSYAAKSLTDKQAKENSELGKKLTIRSYCNQQGFRSSKYQQANENYNKESNFSQLKKQIRYLQNSQILSMKYDLHTEPNQNQGSYQFKITGKQFFPNKKVAHYQKFKLYLKKKGKSKRLSILLNTNNKNLNIFDYNCLDSLKVKDLNIEAQGQIKLKKNVTPYIVKKFYRPMSSNHKSLQELNMRSNQIRGRRLRTSVTNRKNKQNVLICCY